MVTSLRSVPGRNAILQKRLSATPRAVRGKIKMQAKKKPADKRQKDEGSMTDLNLFTYSRDAGRMLDKRPYKAFFMKCLILQDKF
jgi:hypothetical protein